MAVETLAAEDIAEDVEIACVVHCSRHQSIHQNHGVDAVVVEVEVVVVDMICRLAVHVPVAAVGLRLDLDNQVAEVAEVVFVGFHGGCRQDSSAAELLQKVEMAAAIDRTDRSRSLHKHCRHIDSPSTPSVASANIAAVEAVEVCTSDPDRCSYSVVGAVDLVVVAFSVQPVEACESLVEVRHTAHLCHCSGSSLSCESYRI